MTDKNEMTPNDFANYFRFQIGVNVIPANSKTKKPLVEWKSDVRGNWQTDPIPEDLHQQWIRENKFKNGLAVICGQVFHNEEHFGKWFNGIDCDNKLGLDEMCPDGIDKIAQITVVEQHANKEKCHIYFYTEEPIQSQAPLEGDNIPKIEIKSGGRFLLYCAGGIHKDGSRIEILNNKQVKTLDKEALEIRINDIFTKYGLTYLNKKAITNPLYQRDSTTKLYEGDNRGQYILSYLDSKKIKNPELNEDDLFYLARKYEKENCVDVYPDDKIKGLVRQAIGYGKNILAKNEIKNDPFNETEISETLGTKLRAEFVEEYLNKKIKKDEKIVRQVLRACFSAYTNDPINLGILSPSSDGKSYVTVNVTDLFPKEDVIRIGRLSPTALIHQHGILVDKNFEPIGDRLRKIIDERQNASKERKQELDLEINALKSGAKNLVRLSGKILLFLDNPQPQTWEMLKPILSHDAYRIEYKTTKGDGSLDVKDTIIEGFPAVIACSAKNEAHNEVWAEIQTRFFLTSTSDKTGKYRSANQLTAKKMGIPTIAKSLYHSDKEEKITRHLVKEIINDIKKNCNDGNQPAYNMFSNVIASDIFPHNEGVSMRHFNRLMGFCNIEALIDETSPKLGFEHTDVILVTLEHIQRVTEILGTISTVPPSLIKFYDEVFKITPSTRLDNSITTTELVEQFGKIYPDKTITSKKLLDNYIYHLIDCGIIEKSKDDDNANLNLYRTASKINANNLESLVAHIEEKVILQGNKIAKKINYPNSIEPSHSISLYMSSCLELLLEGVGELPKYDRCFNFDTIFTGFSTEISNCNLITIEDFRHEYEPIWKSSRVRPSSLFEETE